MELSKEDKIFELLDIPSEVINANSETKALIFHSNKTIRATIANILGTFGIPTSNVKMLDKNHEEASTLLEQNKYEIVICEEIFNELDFKVLLNKHEEIYPDRIKTSFIVVSSESSLSGASVMLENFIDAFLITPINLQSLHNTLIDIFTKKLNPSLANIAFCKARALFIQKKFDESQELFEQACKLPAAKSYSLVFLAMLCEQDKELEKAMEHYNEGHLHDPDNYLCLHGLIKLKSQLDMNQEAYELNKLLLEKFPFNPNHIPIIIKLSIATKNYDDIIEISQMFQKVHLLSEKVRKYLAAGLVVGGKMLLINGKQEEALQIIDNGLSIGKKFSKIVKSGCLCVAESKLQKEASALLQNYSGKNMSKEEFNEIQLEIFYLCEDYDSLLKMGASMMAKKSHPQKYYEMLITSAKKTGLSQDRIENMVEVASGFFPTASESLKKLL